MTLSDTTLGIIGTGVMGQALMKGLLEQQVVSHQSLWAGARTEASCKKNQTELGVKTVTDYQKLLSKTDILLLCVKPSGIDKVLDNLKTGKLSEKTLIISIVAGTTLAYIEEKLETLNPVIRAMPNTPCIVGEGMTVICGGVHAKPAHLKLAHKIFESVGKCMELDESHFDAITGLSGSGPAYLYLIMEALADGGVRVGLPRDVALKIVTQTVLGAATMVKKSGRHPASLRDDVTTPAGCTIGALLTMEDGKIRSVLARAVEEATRIAGQLGHK